MGIEKKYVNGLGLKKGDPIEIIMTGGSRSLGYFSDFHDSRGLEYTSIKKETPYPPEKKYYIDGQFIEEIISLNRIS